MSSAGPCELCEAPKAGRRCALCQRDVCRNCVEFLEDGSLRFHPAPPAWASQGVFCAECHAAEIEPELQRYAEVAERAERVRVVYAGYRGFVPCLRKAKEPVTVKENAGRGIVLQRLRFLAAWESYDAVIEVELDADKKRNHGWESRVWGGKGLFACLDYRRFHPED